MPFALMLWAEKVTSTISFTTNIQVYQQSSSHVFHQHGLPTATPAVTEIDMVYVVKMYM